MAHRDRRRVAPPGTPRGPRPVRSLAVPSPSSGAPAEPARCRECQGHAVSMLLAGVRALWPPLQNELGGLRYPPDLDVVGCGSCPLDVGAGRALGYEQIRALRRIYAPVEVVREGPYRVPLSVQLLDIESFNEYGLIPADIVPEGENLTLRTFAE